MTGLWSYHYDIHDEFDWGIDDVLWMIIIMTTVVMIRIRMVHDTMFFVFFGAMMFWMLLLLWLWLLLL